MMDQLIMYTIYRHPSDYPSEFVCRRWTVVVGRQGEEPLDKGEPFLRGGDLETIRAQLPPGLFNLRREAGDESQIVETWV